MSGYIMDFDHFVRGCAPCPKLGGVRFVSLYWGGGVRLLKSGIGRGVVVERGIGDVFARCLGLIDWCFCTLLPYLDTHSFFFYFLFFFFFFFWRRPFTANTVPGICVFSSLRVCRKLCCYNAEEGLTISYSGNLGRHYQHHRRRR